MRYYKELKETTSSFHHRELQTTFKNLWWTISPFHYRELWKSFLSSIIVPFSFFPRVHSYSYVLPTRSFRKKYVVGMLPGHSFNKLDTCEIFPMSHRLLEQCLVSPREVTINFVRYHAMVPNALFSRSRGSSNPPRLCIRFPFVLVI